MADSTLTPEQLDAQQRASAGEGEGGGEDADATRDAAQTWDSESTPPTEPRSTEQSIEQAIAATGRYQPIGVLGKGGMGVVWRVKDVPLGRIVALKVVRPDRLQHSPGLEIRFQEEAQVTAQLQHPAIVPVFDVGRLPNGALFYTMREVAGRTLEELVASVHAASVNGPWKADPMGWTFTRLVDVVRTVAEAVGLAHAQSVLHRDLKPANVLVGAHGEVFVLDWGLAKILGGSSTDGAAAVITSDRSASGSHATVAGQVAGTRGFMAPEQARGEVSLLSPASDVYALGGILYNVATGDPPDPDPDACEEGLAIAQRQGRLPEGLARIIRSALRPAALARPRDARELVGALAAWLDGARHDERIGALVLRAESAMLALPTLERSRATGLLMRLLDTRGAAHPRLQKDVAPTPKAAEAVDHLLANEVIRRAPDSSLHLVDDGLPGRWPRLGALAADQDGLRNLDRLANGARAWQTDGRPERRLLAESELDEVERWTAGRQAWLQPVEVAWLERSAEAREAAKRGRRRLAQVGALGLVLVAATFGLLWMQAEGARDAAEEARDAAVLSERRAQAGLLLARASSVAADGLEPSALALFRAAASLEPDNARTRALVSEMAASERAVWSMPAHTSAIHFAEWSPDGQWIATAGADGLVRTIRVDTGETGRSFDAGANAGLQWLDDGRLGVMGEDLRGWRLDPGSEALEGPFGHRENPLIAIRPRDGAVVLAGEHTIGFTEGPQSPDSWHSNPIIGWYGPDSSRLLIFSMNGKVSVVDGETLAFVRRLGGSNSYFGKLKTGRALPKGAALVFSVDPYQAWMHSGEPDAELVDLNALTGMEWPWARTTASPDGRWLATANSDQVAVVQREAGRPRHVWTQSSGIGAVRTTSISAGGGFLALGGMTGQIAILDLRTGAPITHFTGSPTTLTALTWSPDGRQLAVADAAGVLRLLDPGLERYRGLLQCDGRRVPAKPTAMRVAGDRLLYLSEGRICSAPLSAPGWATSIPGSWADLQPGIRPDEVLALSTDRTRVVRIDAATGTETDVVMLHKVAHRLETDAADGSVLAWGRGRDKWKVFLDDRPVMPLSWGRYNLALSTQLRRAVSWERDLLTEGSVLLDLDSGEEVTHLPYDHVRTGGLASIDFDVERSEVLLLGPDGGVLAYAASDGALLGSLGEPLPGATRVQAVPGGEWVLGTSRAPAIRAWRRTPPEGTAWTTALPDNANQITVLGEAEAVAVSTAVGTRVLALDSGRLLLRLSGATQTAFALAGGDVVSPTKGADPQLAIWRLGTLPDDPSEDAGGRTNLRVCPETLGVVPVVPFPPAKTVWAPAEACPEG
jgi:serine/threonine protein kinase/WD40 repeat protein